MLGLNCIFYGSGVTCLTGNSVTAHFFNAIQRDAPGKIPDEIN